MSDTFADLTNVCKRLLSLIHAVRLRGLTKIVTVKYGSFASWLMRKNNHAY